MKKCLFGMLIVLCCTLVFSGCESDDNSSDSTSSSENAGGDSVENLNDDSGENEPSAFSQIIPTGITQVSKDIDKVTNTSTLRITCDAIEGAIRYMFSISISGKTYISATPVATFQVTVAQGSQPYDCWVLVYSNDDMTQPAMARLNE